MFATALFGKSVCRTWFGAVLVDRCLCMPDMTRRMRVQALIVTSLSILMSLGM